MGRVMSSCEPYRSFGLKHGISKTGLWYATWAKEWQGLQAHVARRIPDLDCSPGNSREQRWGCILASKHR